jgi:dTDP-4-dehydrorhamnose reductase
VTGAGGQLGRAAARIRPDAVLLAHRELDVTDPGAVAKVVSRHGPDAILHAAAWTAVDSAEAEPDRAWAVNVGGTEAVARAAQGVGALLLYPSTDYVFSGNGDRPYREADAAKPRSVYGRTKLEGEVVAQTCPRHLVVRASWVFGEGSTFVAGVLRQAREGGSLAVVDDQVGVPTYALDLAEGIFALADRGFTGTFHLRGGGHQCSWADVAEAALDAGVRHGVLPDRPDLRRITTEEWTATRPGQVADRPRYSVLDCSRAESAGVRLRPWPDALDAYVATLKPAARGGGPAGEGGRA